MGTFVGHLIPGLCFIVWAFLATYGTSVRFFKSKLTQHPSSYRNCISLKGLPVSARTATLLSTFLVFVGILLEIAGLIVERTPGNLQHITMYSGFVVALTTQFPLAEERELLFPRMEYAALVLAAVSEAILFMFHLHGQTVVEAHYHQLLITTIVVVAVLVVLEAAGDEENVLLALFRSYSLMLQGFWFIVVGFCLHGPFPGGKISHGEDERNMIISTFLFAATAVGTFGFVNLLLAYLRRGVAKEMMENMSMETRGAVNMQMSSFSVLGDEDELGL